MTHRPTIGLTLDAEEAGGWSRLPWYAIRQNYFGAVAEAGGLPVALPHHAELAEQYLDRLDGLVVTGGAFDVDPALYGGGEQHETVVLKQNRTAFELAVLRGALERDMPVLGICGGEQLLAVALGGTLIQHIPDALPAAMNHEQPEPRTIPGHEVSVVPGTLLSRVVGGASTLAVNSSHHQAVATAGAGAVVSGTAPDGVIEAIEHPGYRFCLGVQWHPEYAVDRRDPDIFRALVDACRAHAAARRAPSPFPAAARVPA